MNSRRKFITTTSQVLIGSNFLNARNWLPTINNSVKPTIVPHSEEYWKEIRKEFDLSTNRAYFNCGTLGPSPHVVLNTTLDAMKMIDATGEMSHSSVEVRQRIAQFVHVSQQEIALTHNTSEGINIMAWGIPLKKGDEVILSNHEHVGNAVPWLNRAQLTGVKVKVLEIPNTDEKLIENLKKLITHKTKAICLPHITCTTGQVLPIKKITELAHSKSILVCVDGAHGAGMFNLDLKNMGCDMYATCGHKWLLGPKGTGFLYVKKEIQDKINPYFVGAGTHIGWEISPSKVQLQTTTNTAERFDYGTNNSALWKGMVAAIDFMEKIGVDEVEKRVLELRHYLLSKLLEFDKKDIEILTPTEGVASVSGILGFKILNKNNKAYADSMYKRFRIRHVPESNLNSIRISTHIFNSKTEIDNLVEALKEYINS